MTSWDSERDAPRSNGRGAVGRRDASDDTEEIDAGEIAGAGDAGGAGATERAGAGDAPDAGEARHTAGAFDTGDAEAPPAGGPVAAPSGPTDLLPPTPAVAGLGLWDDPVPGDDPLPSTGSLKWAPDPTEPLPSPAPGTPAGTDGPAGWPDPVGGPGGPGPGGPGPGGPGGPGPGGPGGASGPGGPGGPGPVGGPGPAGRGGPPGWPDPPGPSGPVGWPDPAGPGDPARSSGWSAPSGPAGPSGPPEWSARPGPGGPSGWPGPPAPSGRSGWPGPAGPGGPSGPGEPSGWPDPTGPAGPSGWSGPPGPGGPSGWSDPAGPGGRSGWPDPAGPAGPSGWSGPSDPSAPGGPSGWSGPPGRSDPSGWPDPPESAAHLSYGPRRPGDDGILRRWPREHLALGGLGVLVAVVAVAAFVVTRDGGGAAEPEESATITTFPAAGDGTGGVGPIVGPTGVIGSWSGSEWVPRPDGGQPGADRDYAVLGLSDAIGTARGEAVAEECAAQRATSETDVAVDLDAGSGPPPIAVAGVAEPRPRPVQVFGTDAEVYHQAAVEVAAGLGASTPPTVTQVLRVDLDGNGTEEVVVAAGHVSDPEDLSPSAGDWSAVFHRRVVGDGVATEVLASSVGGGGDGFDHIQVATIADLNGDGIMEVALNARSASGGWTSIHALDGNGVPSEVLRAGCEG